MEDKKPFVKRPDVLKKLNAENLHFIERGLLGDLPDRFKPQVVPVRGECKDLVLAKPQGILSSCLPVPILDSPSSEKGIHLDEEAVSPLKKSFSFREKISKMNIFSKDKDKTKWKTIVEEEKDPKTDTTKDTLKDDRFEHDYKSHKRFWFFRNKELVEKREKSGRPSYKRSKSFEFLPRAINDSDLESGKMILAKNQSYAFGSSDTIIDSWGSNESLDQLANVYYDKVDTVHLKSIRELPQDSDQFSSTSATSSGGLVVNIMKSDSVQDLLDEFNKTVDMFSENYLSDSEPYTKSNAALSVKEKRKSSSFSTLPSPKIVQVTKMNKIDDGFKAELAKIVMKRQVSVSDRSVRRGSVTDWFVLEENLPKPQVLSEVSASVEDNRYRRAQKKPIQRVRRISSTKYEAKMSKPKLSEEERKERTLAEQKRREKLRSGVLREEYFRKERERYLKKKAAGVVVPRSAMTSQKLRGLRKKNLVRALASYKKRQQFFFGLSQVASNDNISMTLLTRRSLRLQSLKPNWSHCDNLRIGVSSSNFLATSSPKHTPVGSPQLVPRIVVTVMSE